MSKTGHMAVEVAKSVLRLLLLQLAALLLLVILLKSWITLGLPMSLSYGLLLGLTVAAIVFFVYVRVWRDKKNG